MKSGFPVYDICTLSEYQQHDILIDRFGTYLQKHYNLHFPHKHNFYHLVFFTKGGGTHAIDFKTFNVQPGQIYFMIPGQVHSWFFEGEADGYIINFSSAFFNSFLLKPEYPETLPFFSGNLDDMVINLTKKVKNTVADLFEDIIEETTGHDRFSFDMIRMLMMRIFTVIARAHTATTATAAPTYNQTLLSNFRKLIEQNYTTLKLPKDYAALLYITPNHLNALCNDILGISAGEVIRQRVSLEAKRMLINPKLSIADIAGRLGFADNSYFARFFKKQADMTPEEFRRTYK
ncbi:helix-turn-helix domain-containing protein [Mucilaginibacter limnophilus]|uniref:Helix-turn-helix domain-containing protein n=1 Tax=Mucilaginibacter limnophilus TaxID=1932778 RepID=A0A3S3TE82_9SPHI|nr:helix-turn-helix domain-containing protein [Mucilaginibacter limnophilus]RVT96529.1 helix-turn-helix domain-containing protein [Mucilaginibacter limnophilus]